MSLLLKVTLLAAWLAPAARTEPAAPDPLAAIEAAQQQLFMRLAPSVVFIHTKTSFGSGFMVSRHGVVAVIKDSRRRFTLQFPEQRSVTIGPETPASAGKDAIRAPL